MTMMNRMDIHNASTLVNIGRITTEDWNIMLGLSRVGRIAFLESLDEQRRDAYNDAEIMLDSVIDKRDADEMKEQFPIPYFGDKIRDLI